MKFYSTVKHSFHQLKGGLTLPPKTAKQPSLGSPRPIRPLVINRRQPGKELRQFPTLSAKDCGEQWEDVRGLLQRLDGVRTLDDHSLTVVSRLGGEEVVLPFAKAIAMLVDAGHFDAASTLVVRWLQPSARAGLTQYCPGHIEKLGTRNPKIRDAMNSAQFSEASAALTSQDLAKYFQVLSYCLPEAKEHSMALFPPLTTDMLRTLDDHVLVDAVNLTLAQSRKLETTSCLAELVHLLSISDDLEVSDVRRAAVMKGILWLALDSNGISDPVLRGKVEELRSRVQIPALAPELLDSLSPELRRELAGVAAQMQSAASRNFNEGLGPQAGLVSVLHEIDFKAAMRVGDLAKAANFIHDSPDELFRAQASEDLLVGVSLRLEQVGIYLSQGRVESSVGAAAEQQASVAREMAVVLAMTGEPSPAESSKTILSLAGLEPSALVQGVLERFGFPDRGDPSSQLRDALPTLCHADHSAELNLVLSTEFGERLVAQAVDDYLSQSELSDDTVVSFFKALAHRVDLRTTNLFQSISPDVLKARHLRIRADQRWADLSKRLVRLDFYKSQNSLDKCTQDLDAWKPGWRVLLLPCLDLTFNERGGIYAMLSAKAIDAAAGDKRGGIEKGIIDMPALDGRLQNTLTYMLDISAGGKALLPDTARLNFMSAVVRNSSLVERTIQWAQDSENGVLTHDKMRWYKGMAEAVMYLQHDPSRLNEELPATHADVAIALWSAVPPSSRENFEKQLKNIRADILKNRKKIAEEKENGKDKISLPLLKALHNATDSERLVISHLKNEDKKDEVRHLVVDLLRNIEEAEPGKLNALMSEQAWSEFQKEINRPKPETGGRARSHQGTGSIRETPISGAA